MLAATFVALFFAVAVVACGGDDDSTSGTAATQAQAQGGQSPRSSSSRSAAKNGASGNSQARSQGKPGSDSAADFTAKQHQDSGGGSAQYVVKGGDNSVQEFGQEAGASEFEAAATALHNFLDARAEGNWAAACQYLSKSTIESFAQLAAQAKSIEDKSCGAILGQLTNPAAKQAMAEEAAKADIGSLRTEGERAFLIYTAGSKTILAMPMANEGDRWKVAGLAGTPLN
jgi:hypothetical protein